ncbi:hypothetical protein A2Z00_00655 [Candidatus Gottesmanbacteria bacterium RBG_13_45_10]|uniref:ATP-grasp domain-containing protein n=1 Tax=Candidatus Gottesmanbacteria bacterium RBG_13_45_10 TaxID=1798370 RepID=A0A1F5ZGQ7_9BACT|nr:MAG: hypothetical protein A2Z00_00655 [Candidatus Gottesmanbacteria bacterium RBG_13_45_10]
MKDIQEPHIDTHNGDNKKIEKIVYIANLSEDVWPFIGGITKDQDRSFEIEENANLADHQLFALSDEDDVIFVSPKPIAPALVDYYKYLFNKKNIRILVPRVHTGQICIDIINDSEIMQVLIDEANSVNKLTLLAYSASHQFFQLVDALSQKGITVYTPESPDEELAWTVNYFGSKSGIRQLAQQSSAREPDLRMPEGMICANTVDAAQIAASVYMKERGVVIKTNKGHSGAGVLIFREGDFPFEYKACVHVIQEWLDKDKYWSMFPIIIEQLIHVQHAVAGGFPNVEFQITKSGKIEFLYYCGCRVLPDGVFKGIEIHDGVVSDRISTRLIDTGYYIGEQYASAGYRGYFDVDFVAAKNGEIYVSESNTRRTGGTHVYKIAQELLGKNFMTEGYVLSDNSFKFTRTQQLTFESVVSSLAPITYDRRKKEGIVIVSANMLAQQQLEYVILAENKKRAYEIEAKMESLLRA